jgi:hypothetical protein
MRVPVLAVIALLATGLLLTAGPSLADDPVPGPPGSDPGAGDQQRSIEMHVGIPGLAYLGQALAELEKKFPAAQRTPFAGQEDVLVVQIPEAGISCYVVGETPEQLTVASVGINFEQVYEGIAESGLRTVEGIGKGSTVNDVLGTYGRAEITGERRSSAMMRRGPTQEDPDALKKYLYPREDGLVSTYFMARGARVLRVVMNDVPLLERFIMQREQSK